MHDIIRCPYANTVSSHIIRLIVLRSRLLANVNCANLTYGDVSVKKLLIINLCLLLLCLPFSGCAASAVGYESGELQLTVPGDWQCSPIEAGLDQYFFYPPDGGMLYVSYQLNPSPDYLAQEGMLEIFVRAFTFGVPDIIIQNMGQADWGGYTWAQIEYTGTQDEVTWNNILLITYTDSHIYSVCYAAPQGQFEAMAEDFAAVLETIQIRPET